MTNIIQKNSFQYKLPTLSFSKTSETNILVEATAIFTTNDKEGKNNKQLLIMQQNVKFFTNFVLILIL